MLFQRMLSTFARPFTQEVAAAGRPALRSLAEFAAVYRDHGLSVQELSTVVTVLTTLEVRGAPVARAVGTMGDSLAGDDDHITQPIVLHSLLRLCMPNVIFARQSEALSFCPHPRACTVASSCATHLSCLCSVVPQLSLAGDSGRVSQNAKAARELERLRKAIAQSKATLETVNKDIDEKQAARFVPTRLRSCWIRPHLRCVAVCVCVCAARSSADIDRTLSQTSELRDRATQAAQASTKLAEDRQAAATAAVAELKQLRTDAAAAQEELRRLQAAVSDAEQRTEVARSAADAEEARAHRAAKRLEALTFKVAAANMDHVDKAREAELARSEYSDVVTQHSTAEAGLEAAREQLAALRHQGDEEDRRLRQLLRHVEDQEAALADIVQRAQDATTAAEAAEERHRVGKEAAVQAEQAARDAQLMFDTVNSELELARQRCVPAWGGVCRRRVDPLTRAVHRTAEAQKARVDAVTQRDTALAELRSARVRKEALSAEANDLESRLQTLRQEDAHVQRSAVDAAKVSARARERQAELAKALQEVGDAAPCTAVARTVPHTHNAELSVRLPVCLLACRRS